MGKVKSVAQMSVEYVLEDENEAEDEEILTIPTIPRLQVYVKK